MQEILARRDPLQLEMFQQILQKNGVCAWKDLLDTGVHKKFDHVRADGRAQKGILLTPYDITTDGLGNLEAPVELIDGGKLRALVEEHLDAKRLDQLAQYRGFGL